MNEDLTPDVLLDLDEVRRIVLSGLQGYRVHVYLFGSRARGQEGVFSDIDVAVLPLEPEGLPEGLLSTIRESLEESHVPYIVDLVEVSQTDPEFRNRVLREGVLWNDFENGSL